MKTKSKISAGFSFLEVMLSVFILASALIVIITFFGKSYKINADSRNQIIATQLAQEGLELALNVRDTRKLNVENYDFVNYFYNNDADIITINVNTSGGSSVIGYNRNYPICLYAWGAGSDICDYTLMYDPDLGYQYETGEPTIFKRQIQSWYGGDLGCGGYCSLNTCSSAIYSLVYWGDNLPSNPNNCNFANKCVVAAIGAEAEKDPNNPKCGNISTGGPSSIDYST